MIYWYLYKTLSVDIFSECFEVIEVSYFWILSIINYITYVGHSF